MENSRVYDFIPENYSPSLRSSKRFSYNSRQSGDYISQVRSIPSSNPIKQPLIESGARNRVSSTENPRNTVLKELTLKPTKSNSIEKVAEDLNHKYRGLEERFNIEIDRLTRDLKMKDLELENMREKLKGKERVLEDFERKIDGLNSEVAKKNEEFWRKLTEKQETELSFSREEAIKQLQERNIRNEEFLEKANVLLREKDFQLQEMANRILALSSPKTPPKAQTHSRPPSDDEVNELKETIEKLTKEINELKRENEILKMELADKQIVISNLTAIAENNRIPVKNFADFLHENDREKLNSDSLKKDEPRFFASRTMEEHHDPEKSVQTEKTKRAFAGNSQHLQETIKVLNQNLSEITQKYNELLKQKNSVSNQQPNDNQTFVLKESLENKTFPFVRGTFGSNTTIFNDRFFGEQVQAIINKNAQLVEENQALVSQKSSIGAGTMQRMNQISREKIQENERLKKRILELETALTQFKEKIESGDLSSLVDENLHLRTRLAEVEENFREKLDESITRIKGEAEILNERMMNEGEIRLKMAENDWQMALEGKNAMIEELREQVGRLRMVLEETAGNDPKAKALLLESGLSESENKIASSIIRNTSSRVMEHSQSVMNSSELARERYHRKILDSLVELIRHKLIEISGKSPEITDLLNELESFHISEENPYEKIQELEEKLRELEANLNISKNIDIPDNGGKYIEALERSFWLCKRENSELSRKIEAMTKDFEDLTIRGAQFEVMAMEILGPRAEKLVLENKIAQVFAMTYGNRSRGELKNEELENMALKKTLESVTADFIDHKRKWLLLSESIDTAIANKEEVGGTVLSTYWSLKDEARPSSRISLDSLSFLEELNKKSVLLLSNEKKFMDLAFKVSKLLKNLQAGESISEEVIGDIEGTLYNEAENFSQVQEKRDGESEELRRKYVENALLLEEMKAESSTKKQGILDVGSVSLLSDLETLRQENEELKGRLRNMDSGLISERSPRIEELEKENERLRAQFSELERYIDELKGVCADERREKEQISRGLADALREMEEASKRTKGMEKINERIKVLEISNNDLRAQNNELEKFVEKARNLEKQVAELKTQNLMLQELREKNQSLMKENDSLRESFAGKVKEIHILKEERNAILKENSELKERLVQCEEHMMKLKKEKEELRSQDDENKQLKMKLEVLYENMKNLESMTRENRRLSLEIDELKGKMTQTVEKPLDGFTTGLEHENEELREKLKELQEKSLFEGLIARTQIEGLREEFSKVMLRLQQFEDESQRLSSENQELMIENKQMKGLLAQKNEEMMFLGESLGSEKRETRSGSAAKESGSAGLKKVKEDGTAIVKTIREDSLLIKENQRLFEDNRFLRDQNETLKREKTALLTENQEIIQVNNTLAQQLSDISTENEGLLGKINAFYLENQDFAIKINSLLAENESLRLELATTAKQAELLENHPTKETANEVLPYRTDFSDWAKDKEEDRLCELHRQELLHFNEIKTSFFEALKDKENVMEFLQEKVELMLNSHARLSEFHKETSARYKKKIQELRNWQNELQGNINTLNQEKLDLERTLVSQTSENHALENKLLKSSQSQNRVVAKYLGLILEIEQRIWAEDRDRAPQSSEIQLDEDEPFLGIFERLANDIHIVLDFLTQLSLRSQENSISFSRQADSQREKLSDLVAKLELLLGENEKLRKALGIAKSENAELRGFKTKMAELQKQIEEMEAAAQQQKIIEEKQSDYDGLRKRIEALDVELEVKRAEILHLKREKDGLSEKINEDKRIFDSQTRQLKTLIANLKEEVRNCYTSLIDRRNERENLMKTNEELRTRVLELIALKGGEFYYESQGKQQN